MYVEPVPPEQAQGLAAAGRTFYSKVLQAMDAEPDEELAGMTCGTSSSSGRASGEAERLVAWVVPSS